jgi:hypothetical protein
MANEGGGRRGESMGVPSAGLKFTMRCGGEGEERACDGESRRVGNELLRFVVS